jgi:predicted transcriptional regulator
MYTYIMPRGSQTDARQMERTQIYLSPEQAEALDREARRTGTTRSYLIREAITERYVLARNPEAIDRALRTSAGAWDGESEDGAAYVERVRTARP